MGKGLRVPALPEPKYRKGGSVAFKSKDHDTWIRGKVRGVRLKSYGPHEYRVKFKEQLNFQVM